MATSFWEQIDERLTNNRTALKRRVVQKVSSMILFRQYTTQLKPLQYSSFLQPGRQFRVDTDWTQYDNGTLPVLHIPRVIVFRPLPHQTDFGAVTVRKQSTDLWHPGVLWDVFTDENTSAQGTYTGIIPLGYFCQVTNVEVMELWHTT